MPHDEKPTKDYLDKMLRHLEGVWGNAHRKWRKIDSFYNRTFDLWPAAKLEERPETYRPSRSRNIIDHAVDSQMAYEAMIHRDPVGRGNTNEESADRLENALKAVLDDSFQREMVLPPKQAGKHLMLYGYAQVYGAGLDFSGKGDRPLRLDGEDPDDFLKREEEFENSRQGWNPFRIRAPHPTTVLMEPDEKTPQYAMVVGQMKAYELADLTKKSSQRRAVYVDESALDKVDPYQPKAYVEHWSVRWHAMMLRDGKLLFVENNLWRLQPYSHAFAGFGQQPTGVSGMQPEFWAVGILDHVLDGLLMQAQQQSAKHTALVRAAYVKRGTRKDDAAQAAQELQNDILTGEQIDWWWEKAPDLPQWLFQAGVELGEDIDEGTFSRQLAGFRQQGVTTVGQQAQLSSRSDRKFIAPGQQLNFLFTIATSNLLRLAEKLSDNYGIGVISIGEHDLKAADVMRNHRIKVTFEVVDAVLELQQKEFALRELQAGVISLDDYWAIARKEDATGIRKRILKDQIRAMPEVQQAMVEQVMREEGFAELADRMKRERAASLNGDGASTLVGPRGEPLPPRSEEPQNPASLDIPARVTRELRQGVSPSTPAPSQRIPLGP